MQEAARLQEQVAGLKAELLAAQDRIWLLEAMQDQLQRDTGKLAVELRHERNKVSFLCGFDGPGHEPWDIRRLF